MKLLPLIAVIGTFVMADSLATFADNPTPPDNKEVKTNNVLVDSVQKQIDELTNDIEFLKAENENLEDSLKQRKRELEMLEQSVCDAQKSSQDATGQLLKIGSLFVTIPYESITIDELGKELFANFDPEKHDQYQRAYDMLTNYRKDIESTVAFLKECQTALKAAPNNATTKAVMLDKFKKTDVFNRYANSAGKGTYLAPKLQKIVTLLSSVAPDKDILSELTAIGSELESLLKN